MSVAWKCCVQWYCFCTGTKDSHSLGIVMYQVPLSSRREEVRSLPPIWVTYFYWYRSESQRQQVEFPGSLNHEWTVQTHTDSYRNSSSLLKGETNKLGIGPEPSKRATGKRKRWGPWSLLWISDIPHLFLCRVLSCMEPPLRKASPHLS